MTLLSDDLRYIVTSIIRKDYMFVKETDIFMAKKFNMQFKEASVKLEQTQAAIIQFESVMTAHGFKFNDDITKFILGAGNDKSISSMARKLPGVSNKVRCPDELCLQIKSAFPLYTIIMELNDDHKWTRERIADWVETLDIDIEFAGQA